MKLEYSVGSKALKKVINGVELEMLCANEDELSAEMKRLSLNKKKVHEIPLNHTIDVLDKCARLWLSEGYMTEHVKILAQITNQSPDLVKKELEGAISSLLREHTEKMISEELGSTDILDGWVETSYGHVQRHPRGLAFHNISGNAFVVIPVSISIGLLSKNCNIVKVSGDEPYFAYALYKSLLEIDSSIADRLSVIYFDSSNSNIYENIVKNSNCVIHWGGEESGKFMANLCAKYQVELLFHGAKISFEVIDKVTDINSTTMGIATDLVLWEQKACLSPRIVFVNKNIDVEEFSSSLANSLRQLTEVFPKAYLAPWNSVKTIQDRQYCLLKYGLKGDVKLFSSFNSDFTVILNNQMPEKEDIDRCMYRFVFVCPYSDTSEVYEYVENNLKSYLQTMGYSGDDEGFINDMARLGVSIITPPGDMSMHSPGTSHDGMFNLQELTYVVSRQVAMSY